jgi:hypothetical protein
MHRFGIWPDSRFYGPRTTFPFFIFFRDTIVDPGRASKLGQSSCMRALHISMVLSSSHHHHAITCYNPRINIDHVIHEIFMACHASGQARTRRPSASRLKKSESELRQPLIPHVFVFNYYKTAAKKELTAKWDEHERRAVIAISPYRLHSVSPRPRLTSFTGSREMGGTDYLSFCICLRLW